jgi:hypothetical protein
MPLCFCLRSDKEFDSKIEVGPESDYVSFSAVSRYVFVYASVVFSGKIAAISV